MVDSAAHCLLGCFYWTLNTHACFHVLFTFWETDFSFASTGSVLCNQHRTTDSTVLSVQTHYIVV